MRGAIIRAALFAAYCLVILAAVAAGVAGYNYGAYVLIVLDLPLTETNVVAARVGGAAVAAILGFVAASFASAALFLLRDIARNTAELVEQGVPVPPSRQPETREPRPPRWR